MGMTISEASYINHAINRARGAYDNAISSARRNAERMGVNPNSGRYAALEQSAQYDKAAGIASTGNEASYNWLQQAQRQQNADDQLALSYARLESENRNRELNRDVEIAKIKAPYEHDASLYKAAKKGYDVSVTKNNDGSETTTITKKKKGLRSIFDSGMSLPKPTAATSK